MSTIINTPNGLDRSDTSGASIIVGTIIGILLILLFLVYVIPALREDDEPAASQAPINTNVTITTPTPPTNPNATQTNP